ncbi:hypothetical protein ABZX92_22735 [Lentzea sp. NPDC006480]|uniref:hypothetical protein n=1 Tax=Lentzea sp. NPDC006480 TaxID=3157176 RepID=UPI0033A6280C
MDPRDRADAMLARARARGRHIVTPDNMTSPMDASDTQQVPRTLVNAMDPRQDPDSTMIIPSAQMGQQPRPQTAPSMPTQPMPVADDAEITQVVQQGVIPTATNHQQTRNSLTQRLNGNM